MTQQVCDKLNLHNNSATGAKMQIDKWKRAVVHLECATDSENFYDRHKQMLEHWDLLKEGKSHTNSLRSLNYGKSRDKRLQATALFLSHADRRYLLTARHILWDELSAKREMEEDAKRFHDWPDHMRDLHIRHLIEWYEERIFGIIFRVRSFDEQMTTGEKIKAKPSEWLMNLGAGAGKCRPYTFSEPDLDLALISLDQRDPGFADELISLGYTAIASDDIADGPDAEGQEIFAVGFPCSIAIIGRNDLPPEVAHWSSSYFSLPVLSFGRMYVAR